MVKDRNNHDLYEEGSVGKGMGLGNGNGNGKLVNTNSHSTMKENDESWKRKQ